MSHQSEFNPLASRREFEQLIRIAWEVCFIFGWLMCGRALSLGVELKDNEPAALEAAVGSIGERGDPPGFAARRDHWAFQAVRRPTPTPGAWREWARNPIDAFVADRLAKEGLAPSSEADKLTLLRRLYFTLTGMPPTPGEAREFLDDKACDAYPRLVERLLQSERYGERWARHWLDVVRFAESAGFETNLERPNAWPYRDYVIRAFNEDRPYDRFIMEQLAGDALGVDEATAFLVGGPSDAVKSPDINLTLQQRMDELHDMVSTAGSAFLGLTVGCARCHDHKFDPISQVDYYSMQALFAGVQHGERTIRTADYASRMQLAEAERKRLASIDRELISFVPLADPTFPQGQTGNSVNPRFPRPAVHPKQNVERFPPVRVKAVRFSVLGTTGGEPCLDELEIFTTESPPRNVALAKLGSKASSSGNYSGDDKHKLEHLNDGLYGNGRSWISNEPGKGWVEIELANLVEVDHLLWGRDREEKYLDRLALKYRIEVRTESNEWQVVASSHDRETYVAGTKAEPAYSADHLPQAEAGRLEELLHQKTASESTLKRLTAFPTVYGGRFEQPGPTYRLQRGEPLQKREQVRPGGIQGLGGALRLGPDSPEQERRLALGRWITDPANPLTARVMVNRLWQFHFGQGIVHTPSDFGHMGGRPTHPDLLDWLAWEFAASGWSVKHIQRLIVLSATYRQSSQPREAGLRRDSESRLLWRFPPRRLEAEAIRDAILAVSGNLDLRMGQRGFDLFEPNSNYVKVYNPKQHFGSLEWRRMVYQSKPRMRLDDTFGAFDCPDAGQVTPRRTSSTTPLQALNLLNSPFMLQQVEMLADRIAREAGPDLADQTRHAFALLFQRGPTPVEQRAACELAAGQGMRAVCRALLNANEFIYVF
jgi:hypothetical protein